MLVAAMANNRNPDPNEELSLAEAAQRYGYKRRTLSAAAKRGSLVARKIGSMWVVKAIDVVTWINFGNHDGGAKVHYKLKRRPPETKSRRGKATRFSLL